MLLLSIDILVLFACWVTVYLDWKILKILEEEYRYDKEVYEAVLLKKMSTHRKIKKATDKVMRNTLGISGEDKLEDKSNVESIKELKSE